MRNKWEPEDIIIAALLAGMLALVFTIIVRVT